MIPKDNKILSNYKDSHQSQPWCVAAILAYDNPTQTVKQADAQRINKMVIQDDIMTCSVSSSKGANTPTAELTLTSGQINYQSRVSPGDYIMIWMGDDKEGLPKLYESIKLYTKANYFNSGFKFMGKVNSVRTIFNTSPTGVKTVQYLITCNAFSEVNTAIYYNPLLKHAYQGVNSADQNNEMVSRISKQWDSFISSNGFSNNVGQFALFVLNTFLGNGPSDKYLKISEGNKPKNTQRTPNDSMLVPKEVANLIGYYVEGAPTYSKLLAKNVGIQRYDNSYESETNVKGYEVRGHIGMIPDMFSNTTVWNAIQTMSNPSINETYVTLRADKDGNINPTFVMRQLPFSTEDVKNTDVKNTQFKDVPKWIIDSSRAIGSFNIGTSDTLRFNFIQVYGNYFGRHESTPQAVQYAQISDGNLAIFDEDVKRHGPRTLIQTTLCEVSGTDKNSLGVGHYVTLMKDWYKDGHLKLTGSITTSGITEPICIGDNLKLEDKLFHIESVAHNYSNNDGFKSFISSMNLSHGITDDTDYKNNKSNSQEADVNNTNSSFIPKTTKARNGQ